MVTVQQFLRQAVCVHDLLWSPQSYAWCALTPQDRHGGIHSLSSCPELWSCSTPLAERTTGAISPRSFSN